MLQRIASSLLAVLLVAPSSVVAQPSSPPLTTPPTSFTQALPANTAGVLLVKTTPEAWTALRQFQLFAEAEPFLANLPVLFLGFNFEDVQPWLGDRAAVAIMPTTGTEEDSETDHSLVLAPVKDASQLPTFIEKIKASRSATPTERQYRGVTILEWPAPPQEPQAKVKAVNPTTPSLPVPLPDNLPVPPIPSAPDSLAIAVLPGYLVTAATAQPIEQLLDSQDQRQPTLDQNPLFQRTMQQPQFERSLIVGYTNLEELARFPQPKAPEITPEPEAENSEAESINSDEPADAESSTEETITPSEPGDIEPSTEETAIPSEAATPAEDSLPDITDEADQAEIPTATSSETPEPEAVEPEAEINATEPADSTTEPTSATGAAFDSLQTLAQEYSVVDGYLWLQPEGIRSQLNSYYKTPQPEKADVLTPQAEQILTQIPGASFLTSSSRNLKKQWQEVVTTFESDATLTSAIDLIRTGVQGITGLDLEKDWLAWMDGEYAAFLFPTNQGPLSQLYPNLNLGLGFVVQTSDRAAAQATLQKFDQFVARQSQGAIAIAKQTIDGQPVTSWEVEESGKRQSFFAHGWVNSDTLVVTSGFGPMKTLNPKPYLPLLENYTFKTATDSFPRPNQGYFYTNLGSSLAFLYGVFQPYSSAPELRDVKRWLGTIYSISASNSATPEKQQFDSLLVLAPAR